MTPVSPVRVVFSALYAESDEFLEVFVSNFLLFTDSEALLVVNLSPGRKIACRSAAASGRVHVINGAIERAALGHTLLAAHIQSLRFATGLLGAFDHFCPMASNSLFVRRFDLAATEHSLAIKAPFYSVLAKLDDLPDVWWWKVLGEDGRFTPFIWSQWRLDTACSYQIEGNFACREDWMEVGRRLDEMLSFPHMSSPPLPYPVEEVLPATVFKYFRSGRHVSICHAYWDRGPLGPVTIPDIVEDLWTMPPEICMAKWFMRSVANPAATAVSTGWSAQLLASMSDPSTQIGPTQRLVRRLMLDELGRPQREEEDFASITGRWASSAAFGPDRTLLFHQAMPAGYHVLTLAETVTTQAGEAAAYAVTEDMDRPLDLKIRIEQPTGAIRIQSGPPEALDRAPTLAGHLYLSPLLETCPTAIRVRMPQPLTAATAHVLRRVVIRHAGHQENLTECHRARLPEYIEAYYMIADLDMTAGLWVGLPFFHGLDVDLTVEVL